MNELEQYFCPNEQCKDYGLHYQGNIAVRGKYGKEKNRELLYCRTCGKRFAATQASALFGLHLPADHSPRSRRGRCPSHRALIGA